MDACVVTVGGGLTSIGLTLVGIALGLVVKGLRDEWKYSPTIQAMKCWHYGHEFKGARNLPAYDSDGQTYHYDFCQRCHTQQNMRYPNDTKATDDR